MAIKLMHAMMCLEYFEDDKGRSHLVAPVTPMSIPRALEATMPEGRAKTPPMIAVLVLWGGHVGQEFTLTYALSYPDGSTHVGPISHKTWGTHTSVTLALDIKDGIVIAPGGVYEFKFLVDGQPIGMLPLPLYWEGEFPD